MELKLEHVTKKYGDTLALNDFSYTFREGIYGILGANGAGKSTMMNLITDNLKRDAGDILFDGRDVRGMGRDFRRVLGYMPQQQGFYEGMTAESFLVYMAELKEIPRKDPERGRPGAGADEYRRRPPPQDPHIFRRNETAGRAGAGAAGADKGPDPG